MSKSSDKSSGQNWTDFAPLGSSLSHDADAAEGYVRQRGGCQFCKGKKFHRSGLRSSDIFHLFFLRYPVRCTRCRQRQYTSFMTASLSVSPGNAIYSDSKKRESWGTWTADSDTEATSRLGKDDHP